MAEKRYYWIKLKDTFLTSDAVDFLMSQKNGANYVVLYQMLCLKTVNTGGELSRQIGEVIIPFDIDKIHRDCKYFEKDTVVVALELYRKLGLVYENKNGFLQIANFDNLVGSETKWAEYKRIERQKNEQEKIGQFPKDVQNDVQRMSSKRLDIDIRDKSIEKDNIYIDNNINIMHEQQDCSLPKENIFITLSLNDNSEFEVTENFLNELKPLYPMVDVEQEFRNMKGWLLGNPKKRKTRTGIKRFITNWLSNKQNNPQFNNNYTNSNNKQNDFENTVSIGYQYPTISISNSNSNTKIKEKEKKQIKEISKNKKKPKTESFNSLIFEYTQNKDLQKAINDFIEMRKLNKSAMSMNAVKLLLGRLNNLAKSDKTKIEMLEESILKSWKSVYPKNDTEQKAEQKKAMDIIQNRRMSAERKFVKVKEQIESDAVYSDLSAKVRGLKFDIAKLEAQNKPTGDMAERLTKLKKQLADRLAEMGYTAEDLEVKYHCPICQDTGYAKGKKCKCLLALEV